MEKSNLTDHCMACDNAKQNVLMGVYCGLTNQKPSFDLRCDKILLKKRMFNRIEDVCAGIELTKRKKNITISNLIVYLLASFFTIMAGLILLFVLHQSGFIATLPFVLMFIGFTILPMAISPLRMYFYERKLNRQQKDQLLAVLNTYGITYESSVSLKKRMHNFIDVDVSITAYKENIKLADYTNHFEHNANEKEVDDSPFKAFVNMKTFK